MQVMLVCQRMMREREELIRSEYDKALTEKLAGELVVRNAGREEVVIIDRNLRVTIT